MNSFSQIQTGWLITEGHLNDTIPEERAEGILHTARVLYRDKSWAKVKDDKISCFVNQMLLGAPGIATRNKGLTTRNKKLVETTLGGSPFLVHCLSHKSREFLMLVWTLSWKSGFANGNDQRHSSI